MKAGGSKTTDGELLEAVKDWRDDASWREFHDRYADDIRLHALRSGLRPADVEQFAKKAAEPWDEKAEQRQTETD